MGVNLSRHDQTEPSEPEDFYDTLCIGNFFILVASARTLEAPTQRKSNDVPKPKDSPELHMRPRRIVLVRHGQSLGNVDESTYASVPDWKVPLSEYGWEQADSVGKKLRELVEPNGKVFFYVSPYLRAIQTYNRISKSFQEGDIMGVREEPRIREQDFGNFQDPSAMTMIKEERKSFGRFFFRFPNGESGADVYDRMSDFIGTLFRNMDFLGAETTVVIVTHGLAFRLFLMRWFHWSVEQFETTYNPGNGEVAIINRDSDSGYYVLDPDVAQVMNVPLQSIRDNRYFSSQPNFRALEGLAEFPHVGHTPDTENAPEVLNRWTQSLSMSTYMDLTNMMQERINKMIHQVFVSNQNEDGLVDTKQIKTDVAMRARGNTSRTILGPKVGSPSASISGKLPTEVYQCRDTAPVSSCNHAAAMLCEHTKEFLFQEEQTCCNDDVELEGEQVDAARFESFIKSVGERSGMPMDELLEILQESSSGRRVSQCNITSNQQSAATTPVKAAPPSTSEW